MFKTILISLCFLSVSALAKADRPVEAGTTSEDCITGECFSSVDTRRLTEESRAQIVELVRRLMSDPPGQQPPEIPKTKSTVTQ